MANGFRDDLRSGKENMTLGAIADSGDQVQQLAKTLAKASTSPYAANRGLTALTPLDDWPILTRDNLQREPDSLLANGAHRALRRRVITSGSTGQPITFWLDQSTRLDEAWHMIRQWRRMGFRLSHRRIRLHGHDGRLPPPMYAFLPITHMSLLQLREGGPTLGSLVRKVAGAWLHTFPSAALHLAELTNPRQWRANPPRGLLLGSETVTVRQEEYLADHFGAPVFSWYGQSEKVLLGGECTRSRQYHFPPDYGIPEIVDAQDRPIRTPGVMGRLIGTGLLNSCAPLVRYDTGDLAAWSPDPCDCGLPGPRIDRVLGRSGDFVVTPGGIRLSLVGLELQSPNYAGIKRLQYVHLMPDRLEVRYLAIDSGLGPKEEQCRALVTELEQLLPGVRVTAVPVEQLEHTSSGKTPLLIRRYAEDGSLAPGVYQCSWTGSLLRRGCRSCHNVGSSAPNTRMRPCSW